MLGELGPVRRCLAAQRRGDPGVAAGADDPGDGVEHGGVGLVEQLGADLGVAVDAEHQLRQVVGADRHAVDAHGRVLGDPVHDRRHLGHHPAVQPALAPERAGVDGLEAGLELPRGAHERDHQVQVRASPRAPGRAARARARTARDRGRSGSSRGTRSSGSPRPARTRSPPSSPRNSFVRKSIVRYTTGRGAKARVIRSSDADIGRRTRSASAAGEQRPRVHAAERVGEHELGPQQADAVDGLGGDLLGVVGDGQVHVEPGGERLGGARRRATAAAPRRAARSWRRDRARVDRAPGAVDGDELAVVEHRWWRCAAPTTQGTPSSRRDDRGVAGHAAAVGDDAPRRGGSWAPSPGWSSARRAPRRPGAGRRPSARARTRTRPEATPLRRGQTLQQRRRRGGRESPAQTRWRPPSVVIGRDCTR